MNFLCPSCRTPLPAPGANQSADCTRCGVRVDLTGIETAPGQAKLWPEVDLAHETLGPFKLVSTLGAGGMGAVYAATSPTGIGVAVKVLAPMLAAEPGLRERFRREAHALRALDHKGVVRILDEGEDRGFSWYAMEKIDGRDLREVLKTKRMTAPEAEALARAVLDALAAVHAAGLVHRDIKPGNILISADGAKLCDFGIARFDGQATLTESAAIMGSLRYMAPEQRWGKSGPLSDLYGVGVCLHEALYGGVPGEVAPSGSVPAWLAQFVHELTRQRAEDRPPTARAALKRLDRLKNRWKVRAGAAAAVVLSLAGPAVWLSWPAAAGVELPPPRPVIARAAPVDVPVDAGPPPARPLGRGTLTVSSEPGAEVWVDGENTGLKSPAALELSEGVHSVVFKRDGRSSQTRDVVITPGTEYALQDVPIPVAGKAPAPPPKVLPPRGKSKKPSKMEPKG